MKYTVSGRRNVNMRVILHNTEEWDYNAELSNYRGDLGEESHVTGVVGFKGAQQTGAETGEESKSETLQKAVASRGKRVSISGEEDTDKPKEVRHCAVYLSNA